MTVFLSIYFTHKRAIVKNSLLYQNPKTIFLPFECFMCSSPIHPKRVIELSEQISITPISFGFMTFVVVVVSGGGLILLQCSVSLYIIIVVVSLSILEWFPAYSIMFLVCVPLLHFVLVIYWSSCWLFDRYFMDFRLLIELEDCKEAGLAGRK